MGQALDRLKQRLADVHNISRAASVLEWDQQVYMPPGGAHGRAEQLATLSRLAHDLFTAEEVGELFERAADEGARLPADSDDAALIRVGRRDYEQSRKIPTALVAEAQRHSTLAHPVWVNAREQADFSMFAPCLEKTIDISRRIAEHLGYEETVYDALLDQFEPGMKTSQVRTLFEGLKRELVPLVRQIASKPDRVDNSILHQPFDEVRQEAFGRMLAERYGYDFTRGRQDRTVHPFETTFSRGDVRITTRFNPNYLNPALFGTLHETGHALYEQNVGEALDGTLLARGTSMGVHESQSRLWENVVGRSLGFWTHFYPELQNAFPDALGSVDLDTFYRAINYVNPSFIRVEADEVTYNLHIMVRFEMENELLAGDYPVSEAPDVWNDKYEQYLGVRPTTDALGILQDVHWSGGLMGYFPTYSLGNVLSVQLFDTATRAHPEIPEQIEQGRFDTLLGWLTENVYRFGRTYDPNDLIQRATGEPLHPEPYIAYLKSKFGEMYALA